MRITVIFATTKRRGRRITASDTTTIKKKVENVDSLKSPDIIESMGTAQWAGASVASAPEFPLYLH